jgi:hypothetical protein
VGDKIDKSLHLPFGLSPDELMKFAKITAGALGMDKLPQTRGNNMLVIPEEMTRLSWSKKMAYRTSKWRKGRVPESHVVWLKEQVLEDPDLISVIFAISGEAPEDLLPSVGKTLSKSKDIVLTETMIKMHGGARWADFGFNIFNLTDSLAAMLSLTDATAKFTDIRLPFPAFFIEVPPGYLPVGEKHKGPVRLLVHEHVRHLDYADDGSYTESEDLTLEPERWLRIEIFSDSFDPHTVINRRVSDLSDDSISNQLMRWVEGRDEDGERSLTEANDDSNLVSKSVSLVCSFALWLNATDALEGMTPGQGKKVRKKGKKKAERKPGAWPTVWIMGREIKLDKELRDSAKEQAQGEGERKPGWKLRTQKIIRGHFKRQHYGTGSSLTKIIFVEPYPRGPDGAEAWSSKFQASKKGA